MLPGRCSIVPPATIRPLVHVNQLGSCAAHHPSAPTVSSPPQTTEPPRAHGRPPSRHCGLLDERLRIGHISCGRLVTGLPHGSRAWAACWLRRARGSSQIISIGGTRSGTTTCCGRAGHDDCGRGRRRGRRGRARLVPAKRGRGEAGVAPWAMTHQQAQVARGVTKTRLYHPTPTAYPAHNWRIAYGPLASPQHVRPVAFNDGFGRLAHVVETRPHKQEVGAARVCVCVVAVIVHRAHVVHYSSGVGGSSLLGKAMLRGHARVHGSTTQAAPCPYPASGRGTATHRSGCWRSALG